MIHNQVILLLLGVLVGSVLAGIGWSSLKANRLPNGATWLQPHDQALMWFLIVAMFALGVFVTYALLQL